MIVANLIETLIGTELLLVTLSLVIFTLLLWLVSKIFKFKEQRFIIAFMVAFGSAVIPFLIRVLGKLIFIYPQTIMTNTIALVLEPVILLMLIRTAYSVKWGKTILAGIVAYVLKLIIKAFLVFFILICCTNIII